jgi:hypothetical protein
LVAVLSPANAVGLAECQVGSTTAVLKELIADAESDWTILNVPPISAG